MSRKGEQSNGGQLGSVLLITVVTATLFSGLTAYVATQWISPSSGEVPFVVLDSSRLLEASIRTLHDQDIASEDVLASAARFSDALNQSTARFVEAGYIVINRGAVLDVDPRLDITGIVAHELGLDLQ